MQVNNDILQAQDVPAQAPATGRPLNHKLQKINPHAFFKGVMVGTANVVQAIVRYAPSGKLNRHTWSSPGQDFADFAVSQISDKQPAYFSMASFDSASVSEWKGRTEVNIKYLRGFWIDIEGSAEKYAKPDGPENGYPDIAAVKLAVLAWVNKTGLTPCFVVVTGSGGMHLHFVLGAALTTDEWLPRAKALGAMAQTNGLKIDGQVTTDAARIMRAPGSIHQGTGNLVKAYSWRQEPYTLAEFDALTGGTGNTTKPFPQPLTKQHGTNDIIGDALHAPYSYSKAAESCPAMRKAGENNGRDTPYPVWILVLKAAELSVEGREYAHSISSGHADYDQADTDKKMDSLTGGPAGCAAWESAYGLNGPCSTCQYQGRTKNPAVQLGGTSATGQPGASQIEALPTSSSDLALANIFVLLNATAMKYDHAVKKWRQYSDGSWRVCTLGEPVECVKKCAPFVLNMAATAIAGDPDSAKGKKLQSLAMRAQSEKGIGSALRLAESDPRMAVRFEMFDTDPDLLNVANGVVHLPSGQFLPHDPALRLAKQCPIAYNAGAQCPVFLLFMEQISCGDPDWIDYMQRQLGYALSGRVHEEKMFFWFGNGRNGKSVLANILRHIMGDYAVIAPVAMFMVSHRDGADATPQLAMLPGNGAYDFASGIEIPRGRNRSTVSPYRANYPRRCV